MSIGMFVSSKVTAFSTRVFLTCNFSPLSHLRARFMFLDAETFSDWIEKTPIQIATRTMIVRAKEHMFFAKKEKQNEIKEFGEQ